MSDSDRRIQKIEQMLSLPSPDAREAKKRKLENRRKALRLIEIEDYQGYKTVGVAIEAGAISHAEFRWLTTDQIRHNYDHIK